MKKKNKKGLDYLYCNVTMLQLRALYNINYRGNISEFDSRRISISIIGTIDNSSTSLVEIWLYHKDKTQFFGLSSQTISYLEALKIIKKYNIINNTK